MKNLFAAAIVAFATQAAAQRGPDARRQQIVNWNAVQTTAPAQEVASPGVYYPKGLDGPGNPYKGTLQFGHQEDADLRVGYADEPSWAWRRACCKEPVLGASGACNCGKTVRRCRNRKITTQHTETRLDNMEVDVPTAHYEERMMPATVIAPVFKTVKVPVKAYRTKHRVEYRNHLATRPPSVVFNSHSPIANLVSQCSCYQPTCDCVGQVGCSCCWPTCSCAPQSTQVSTNTHTTGKNRTFVRKVPVRVPYKEEYIKYIDQKVALNRPHTVLRKQKVLTNGSTSVNVQRPTAVVSNIPGTVEECWNEYVFDP